MKTTIEPYRMLLIGGNDTHRKAEFVAHAFTKYKDVTLFDPNKFAERDPIHLYASEADKASKIQHMLYRNNNKITSMWVDFNGINVEKEGDVPITKYERYTILLSFFLLEQLRFMDRVIIIEDFALNGDDFKVLDFLDTIRNLIVEFGLNFILITNSDKNASLACRKFSFLNSEFLYVANIEEFSW